ncbi:MAG: hypothetical protein NTU53_00550 [Planctomycetota bacterium]|nr:hypothetical protein [Planctomycetota bacterium]
MREQMLLDGSILNLVGLAAIWLLLFIAIGAVVWRLRCERRQKRLRGFEVKLIAGERPAAEESEKSEKERD